MREAVVVSSCAQVTRCHFPDDDVAGQIGNLEQAGFEEPAICSAIIRSLRYE